jgi:predicted RNase H-like nuclease
MKTSHPPNSSTLTWDSAPTATYLGIDGARGGWVVATWTHGVLSLKLYRSLSEIPIQSFSRVLVDMPIGLPTHHRRACDAEARALLGPRRSTIFPVPTRAATYATSYQESCAINESLQGCKVSKQAWNLCPKIRELDLYLRSDPSRHTYIAEGHPELAFRALHPSASSLPSKRTPLGLQLRREALDFLGLSVESIARELVASHPKSVDMTDAYDALSLCAILIRTLGKVSFVGDGSIDEYGAPERICVG